jgi:hypothetical protein
MTKGVFADEEEYEDEEESQSAPTNYLRGGGVGSGKVSPD